MNREQREEYALLYALGSLPEDETEAFEKEASEDRELQRLIHENQRLQEEWVRECEPVEPPFQSYSRIMSEIDSDRTRKAPSEKELRPEAPVRRVVPFLNWGGWAAAACVALVFSVLRFGNGGADLRSDIVLNNLANPKLMAVETPSEDIGIEDRMLELVGIAEAYWFAREGVPSDQLLADSATEIAPISGGFTVFDRTYKLGFIAVENMPNETAGKSYHVWAKTSPESKPIRAGALPIGDESRGLFFFDLSSLPKDVDVGNLSFFVTEEESDDPAKPSQMIVLSDF
ncbi:anti-sigma factor [Pelagicoccus sp. SDUM812003]|uniref:anti-sigma factor n=1 Tax=Pelagicoccus sp. SDUM812003 TaxID=3041267 RepID=UPI00280E5B96|nr:anti-sigma factor [Pelagicoccus sp. SDUM812003]MDQ8204262.1 anti-sigma factor [Pelagicoccus sp. SDUM812003]